MTTVVERYIAIWNETDPRKRRDLIGWTFTEDAAYLDPMLSGEGHAGLGAMFEGVFAQLPGARVSLSGEPDAHHDWVRFSWTLVLPGDSESFIEGTDLGLIGPDGRFARIVGFLDKVPAAIAG
ncbi:MAG TPA: nuclear transport factor 2 family protein [Thermomicrobiales bacterium]|nr:nuclear transport factor 2 family protein [Thermomicrobiales bacterium]